LQKRAAAWSNKAGAAPQPRISKDQRRRAKGRPHPSIGGSAPHLSEEDRIREMLARTLTALAGAALLGATPAVAQDAVSLSVDTSDLNLATEADRATLDRRIRKAANKVCDMGSAGLPMQIAFQVCRTDVLASAGKQVQQLAANKSGRIQLARNTR
jgi:UrcA family protein